VKREPYQPTLCLFNCVVRIDLTQSGAQTYGICAILRTLHIHAYADPSDQS
jgi:hypothetical protein